VHCWGLGEYGQLGYGNTNTIGDDEHPTQLGVELGDTVAQVTAGAAHTCIVVASGAVHCWGDGASGQLGYSNTITIGDDEHAATAGNVVLGSPIKQLAAGDAHTCALSRAGAIHCWGANEHGQLGYGYTENIGDNEKPNVAGHVEVNGIAAQIAAGARHTCALLDTGAVACWGSNDQSQLGYAGLSAPAIGDDELPAAIGTVNVGGPVLQLVAGGAHTCALMENHEVRCWGANEHGQLGHGHTKTIGKGADPAAAPPVPLERPVRQLAAGEAHTCALLDTGTVRCWGLGLDGRLGYASTESIGDDELPTTDVDLGGTAVAITAGRAHTCAFLRGGAIRCWGLGLDGRLGYGNTDTIGDDETPASAGDVPYR
jgi:alpha-tubulin suppressor-like RCC1 family protein